MSKNPGGCVPPNSGPPDVINDPCTYLGELRGALYALMTGRQTAMIRHGNYEQRFTHQSVVELQREIRRLEASCPRGPNNPHGGRIGSVRAGPYSTGGIGHPALGPLGYPSRPSRFW
jgi:hypothetical protein